MNSLRTIPSKALPLATRTRFFSTSPLARKSAVDAAKDAAKTIDRTVADAAVKGIEKGGKSSPILSHPLSSSPIPSLPYPPFFFVPSILATKLPQNHHSY